MGCSGSTNANPGQLIAEEYAKKGLPAPDMGSYDNEFEREAYQVVNLIRNDPKSFIP